MKGNVTHHGHDLANGPYTPGKRDQYGMPPPPVSIYTLTGWETPE